MAGAITPITRWVILDNGVPVPGAKLYTKLSGTDVNQPVYSDPDLNISHARTNPVVADAEGVLPICYLAPVAYRFLVTDADGATVYPTQDNVYDFGQLALAGGFPVDPIIDGTLTVTRLFATDQIAVGETFASDEYQVDIGGPFGPAQGFTNANGSLQVDAHVLPPINGSVEAVNLAPTFTVPASGTSGSFSTLQMGPATIIPTSGSGVLNNAIVINIVGSAVTGGGTNYVIRSAPTGAVEFGAANNMSLGGAFSAAIQCFFRGTYAGATNAIQVSTRLQPSAGSSAAAVAIEPTVDKAATGTHAFFASLRVAAPAITSGLGGLTNAVLLDLSGSAVTGGASGNYVIRSTPAGAIEFGAANNMSLGGAATPLTQLRLLGTYAGASVGIDIQTRLQPAVGDSAYGFISEPTIDEAGSGTHVNLGSILVRPPTITVGAGSVTNATTLEITDAPSAAGATNRALWVRAGLAQFSGTVAFNNTVSAAAAVASTHKMAVSIGGSTYYLLATDVP